MFRIFLSMYLLIFSCGLHASECSKNLSNVPSTNGLSAEVVRALEEYKTQKLEESWRDVTSWVLAPGGTHYAQMIDDGITAIRRDFGSRHGLSKDNSAEIKPVLFLQRKARHSHYIGVYAVQWAGQSQDLYVRELIFFPPYLWAGPNFFPSSERLTYFWRKSESNDGVTSAFK